jgi:hypothetical protein
MKSRWGLKIRAELKEKSPWDRIGSILLFIGCLLCAAFPYDDVSHINNAFAQEDPLARMSEETISYFKPLTGRITEVSGSELVIDLGNTDSVQTGMRFTILREDAPFRHPVTKEPLGQMEVFIGEMEIQEVLSDTSRGYIISGDVHEGDIVRISEIKIDLVFIQSDAIDWYLADSYYRRLKETDRFDMIDTSLETDDPTAVTIEAQKLNADVALLLTSVPSDSGVVIRQSLFWTSDGKQFLETDAYIPSEVISSLRAGDTFFALKDDEVLLTIDLPIHAKLLTEGDINGDGKAELVLSTGKDLQFYIPGAGMQPAFGDTFIKGSTLDDHLWLDTIDLNRNGRDEVVVTSMKGNKVVSCLYELNGSEFKLLYEDELFLRRMGERLMAQEFSRHDGFFGKVFSISYAGGYQRGDIQDLPETTNIYDYIYIGDPQGEQLLLVHDENGYLSAYDRNKRKIWSRQTRTGGFPRSFKKSGSRPQTPPLPEDSTEWSVKDRLYARGHVITFIEREPILNMVKGLGYKSSRIKTLWWNGLSMEEGVLIDDISGSVYDYAFVGDKVFVIKSPLLGFKPGYILKGENPVRTELCIYSIKGI